MVILMIAYKDLLRSKRSAFAVATMVIAPLGLVGLLCFALGGASSGISEPAPISVGLVNADSLPADAPLQNSLGEDIRSLFFGEAAAPWMTARDYPSETAARAAVKSQEIGVAIVIPPEFTGRLLNGETELPVVIITDPTLEIAPQMVQHMVTATLGGVMGSRIAMQTVMELKHANDLRHNPAQIAEVIDRYATWYAGFQRDLVIPSRAALAVSGAATKGRSADSVQEVLPMMMAGQMAFFAFFTAAFSMMSIVREDEEGTLARLFTAPVRRASILAGKFLAVFLSVAVQGIVLIVTAHYAFGVSWGAPPLVVLALIGQVVAATGLGTLMIAFIKNTRQGGPVLGGGLAALGMLGGLFTANIPLPETFAALANFTPQGWVIKSWSIVLNGKPGTGLLLPFVVTMGMGLLMFALGAMTFRKRYA